MYNVLQKKVKYMLFISKILTKVNNLVYFFQNKFEFLFFLFTRALKSFCFIIIIDFNNE